MIRYPGSKAKLVRRIIARFPYAFRFELFAPGFALDGCEYREPFFGAGAVGMHFLGSLPRGTRIWLNDLDYGLVSMWNTILDCPDELIEQIDVFEPSAERFYEFKARDGEKIDPALAGFRKLALHMMSFSGLGAMAGGPLGGRNGASQYAVGCRWNPSRLKRYVQTSHKLLRRFQSIRITCRDFAEVIKGADARCLIYADPPYYAKGGQLYKHSMAAEDHERLARLLQQTSAHWVLSYDDHPQVRRLYAWANCESVAITYTTATARAMVRRKNEEMVITPMRVREG